MPTIRRTLTEIINTLKSNVASMHVLNLDYLDLNNEGINAIAEALKRNKTLTEIYLWKCKIGPEGAIAIAEALKINKTLTYINLSDNNIGPEGAIAIAEALKINETLTYINLDNNNIGPEGAIAIAEALKHNKALTIIYFPNNISPECIIVIAEALKINKTLTHLDLSNSKIDLEVAIAIAEALKINKTLTHLYLSNSKIDPEGAIAIAEVLKINKTLTSLSLDGSSMGPNGVKVIAEALKKNTALTHINLSRNNINTEGGIAIAEALKINETLTHLMFNQAYMDTEGVIAITEALKINKTLTYIDLSYDNFTIQAAKAIAEALKHNKTLTSITLLSYIKSNIKEEVVEALEQALEHNYSIIKYEGPRTDKIDSYIRRNRSLLQFSKQVIHYFAIYDTFGKDEAETYLLEATQKHAADESQIAALKAAADISNLPKDVRPLMLAQLCPSITPARYQKLYGSYATIYQERQSQERQNVENATEATCIEKFGKDFGETFWALYQYAKNMDQDIQQYDHSPAYRFFKKAYIEKTTQKKAATQQFCLKLWQTEPEDRKALIEEVLCDKNNPLLLNRGTGLHSFRNRWKHQFFNETDETNKHYSNSTVEDYLLTLKRQNPPESQEIDAKP